MTSTETSLSAEQAWVPVNLPGKRPTTYRWMDQNGARVIEATADKSASMLRRTLKIDACGEAKVRFSWRLDQANLLADVSQSDLEDASVRVILAFDGDHAKLSMRNQALFEMAELMSGERPPYATLMYVWDHKAATDSVVVNPRTDRIRDLVVESGTARLGRWLSYERDVAADYRRVFGEEPGRLIGLAIMTDSDNTGTQAQALYRDVDLVLR
ncbi:MAG: DUF3047 domain-containing protein [Leptothrix ochracea]|uniref:DUF3047 domain-containing protein n=1 Tax=Leptothrix ochracea TaxID=735331 RepID=UPI0034E2686A